MGKKRSWFSLVKRLFIHEGKSKEQKKSQRWRWVFGRLKIKQYPAISLPQQTLGEATAEQRKHAVAVAIATAAAAEAAVTAAHAAAEVVRLTSSPSYFSKINHNLAATKIQTSFRSYLARKALRALKGVVMLQAVIRGQNIRRLIITNLKPLPSTLKTQSKVHQIKVSSTDESCIYGKEKASSSPKKMLGNKNTKLGCRTNKNWNHNVFSNEDTKISWLQSQDAIIRRDRMMKYSSHRERRNNLILEDLSNKEDGRRRPWFEELKDGEVCGANLPEKLKPTIHSNSVDIVTNGTRHLKLRNGLKMDILNSSLFLPRRSFCIANKHEKSVIDEISLPNSPVFPAYMAATESAKAKLRSASTPRQSRGNSDFCAIRSSLYKPQLSSWSSFDGDLAGMKGNRGTTHHKPLEYKVK